MGTTQSTISGNIGFSLSLPLKHNFSLPDIELFFRELYFFFVAGVKKKDHASTSTGLLPTLRHTRPQSEISSPCHTSLIDRKSHLCLTQ